MDKPEYTHPVGFLDTLATDKIEAHATCRIGWMQMHYLRDVEGFKDHVVDDLARQLADLIREKMDVFWRTLPAGDGPGGDTEVHATIRLLNEAEWRNIESQLFERQYEQKKSEHINKWQLKQKLLQTQFGSIRRASPIVLPHCN